MVLAQNIHVDQWNRIEDPEVSPHSYSILMLYKDAKNIQWKKACLISGIAKSGCPSSPCT
jgi:hypothetical protein